jgi:hypothetical protein
MKLPWKIVKKTYLPSDKKIDEIRNILFPPLQLNQEPDKDGTIIKYHVDFSVDSNLEAAIIDLEEGINDPNVRKTLTSILDNLLKVRRMLDAYASIDKDAQYIIVDDGRSKDFDDIVAADEKD